MNKQGGIYKMNGDKTPPIKVDEVLTEKCISIGKKGDGIFKYSGFVIIASEAQVGQTYKLKITKVFPTVAFASIEEEL